MTDPYQHRKATALHITVKGLDPMPRRRLATAPDLSLPPMLARLANLASDSEYAQARDLTKSTRLVLVRKID